MSHVITTAQRWKQNGLSALAVVLAGVSVAATLERSHYLATHVNTGPESLITTAQPAPAASAIFPTGSPSALTNPGGSGGFGADGGVAIGQAPTGGLSSSPTVPSTPAATDAAGYRDSVVVAQVHALTASAAIQACIARLGQNGNCTTATEKSLGTSTGLTIVHGAPASGEVRVLRSGEVYSATAAAQRGVWYAVTINVANGAQSRTCLSHHGRQRCNPATW